MTLKRLGALRYAGDDFTPDFAALPTGTAYQGATFDATDVGEKYVHNGTNWIEFVGGSGGGITGLEPNSTILEYLNSVPNVFTDYTTPVSATATTPTGVSVTELKSYWKFDESATPVLNESTNVGSVDSLSDADIVVTAGTFLVPGIIDEGVSFDGSTSFGDVGTSLSQYNFFHQANETWSIVFWYRKLDGLWDGTQTFLDDTNAQNGTGIFFQGMNTGILRFVLQNGASNEITFDSSASFLPDDTNFHMITITGDYTLGSNQITYTIDNGTPESGGASTTWSAGNAEMALDICQLNNGLSRMDVVLDEYSIWNRVLTAGEITLLWNGGSAFGIGGGSGAFADKAIDGDITTFWVSDSLANQSITLDMGSVVNCYGLAYYIDKTQTGITETQFQIKSIINGTLSGNNLLAYYKMDESSGNLVNSSISINAIANTEMVPQSTVAYSQIGVINTGVGVSGGTEKFSATSSTAADWGFLSQTGTAWTFCGWAKSTDSFATENFIACTMAATGGQSGIVTRINTSGTRTLVLQCGSVGVDLINIGSTIAVPNDANYHFIVYQYDDATGDVTFRIDDQTPEVNGGHNLTNSTDPSNIMNIGSDSGSNFSNSDYDEFGFFDRVLTSQELDAIYNGGSGARPLTGGSEITLRTVSIDTAPNNIVDGWNFIRFNGVNTQFLSIEGSSNSALVMAANELAVQVESDPPLTTLHGQFTINGTDIALPLNGGDPTSSVINDPSTNSMTLVSAVEQSNPPTDGMVMWNEILDANNSVSHSKMKIDGAIKNVRWF